MFSLTDLFRVNALLGLCNDIVGVSTSHAIDGENSSKSINGSISESPYSTSNPLFQSGAIRPLSTKNGWARISASHQTSTAVLGGLPKSSFCQFRN
jgi:hypothetical protein